MKKQDAKSSAHGAKDGRIRSATKRVESRQNCCGQVEDRALSDVDAPVESEVVDRQVPGVCIEDQRRRSPLAAVGSPEQIVANRFPLILILGLRCRVKGRVHLIPSNRKRGLINRLAWPRTL